ncbi:MAG: hypothetical protein ACK4P4_01705 [Allorhizobium sp.]
MKKSIPLSIVLGIMTAFLSNAAWAQGKAAASIRSGSYDGDVTLEVMAPQSDHPIKRQKGTAQVTFSRGDDGQIAVVGVATIDGRQALRLENMLSLSDNGAWSDGSMILSRTGEIRMQKVVGDLAVTAAGEISGPSMTLHVRTARLSWEGADNDTELDLAFTFDLVSKTDTDRTQADGNKCRTVMWQPRQIANPFGGSMSTIMVPVCVPSL